MATNGWDVTGVDFVARALKEAQRRAQAAGVKIDFRQGDVTKLAAATRFCSILGATTGSNASSGPATRKA
jgi:2-polyprenyl-3-methyl-5-hydroxy-6-metoxy-1,4-benzoquinol methylase